MRKWALVILGLRCNFTIGAARQVSVFVLASQNHICVWLDVSACIAPLFRRVYDTCLRTECMREGYLDLTHRMFLHRFIRKLKGWFPHM